MCISNRYIYLAPFGENVFYVLFLTNLLSCVDKTLVRATIYQVGMWMIMLASLLYDIKYEQPHYYSAWSRYDITHTLLQMHF